MLLKKLGLFAGLTFATLSCNLYEKLENVVENYKPADKIVYSGDDSVFSSCKGSYKQYLFGDTIKIIIADEVKESDYLIPQGFEMKWKNH